MAEPRLVIEIDSELKREFKVLCAMKGKTMSDYILDLIRRELQDSAKA